MQGDEWDYVAEGGLHVVCRCRSKRGKVLRLRKSVEGGPVSCSRYDAADDAMGVIWRTIFGGQVVLESQRVPLDEAFLIELSRRIEPHRPVQRRHATIDTTVSHGQLLDDASQLLPPACEDVVTVELKVKCGLKSSSPFTPSSRGLKRRLGRFHLMQLYKQAQSLQTDNNAARGRAVSLYDPCLLCSGNDLLVSQALHALVANPQNNLLLFRNGHPCAKLSSDGDGTRGGHAEHWDADLLVEAVSAVLARSDILPRLQMAQSLDFIDIEGASLAFARVERELGGRHAAEQAVLESFRSFDYAAQNRLVSLLMQEAEHELGNAAAAASHPASARAIPAPYASPMEVLFHLRLGEEDTVEEEEKKRRLASAFLDSCSATACLELLQYWLLALTAKDASLMISLAFQSALTESTECRGPCQGSITITPEICNGALPIRLVYSMGLVDMGLKHPRKCWSKADKEEAILQAIASISSIK